MQASTIAGMRIAGVLMTWQGPLVAFQHSTAVEMCAQCAERGMLFGLVLDPWCAKTGPGTLTTNVQNALLNSTTQAMLNSTAYLPEKFVLDFSTGADLATLGAAFPSLKFLAQNTGFSWISIPSGTMTSDARNAAAVANLKVQNANPAMQIPGVCREFNDAGPRTPPGEGLANRTGTRDNTQSVWGGAPARVLDNQGGNFFYAQLAVTPMTAPSLGLITWN